MTIAFAHGFTQTSRSWDTFIDLLAAHGIERSSCLAVDMPGHGTATAITADLWAAADRLVHQGGQRTYVGYSMGGRVALHAALSHPGQVERLVLIGATPGIGDDDERIARRYADEALADHIEDVGIETFIDEWLANPLFAGLTKQTAQRADRLRNTAAGLASSLRHTGTGSQTPLWNRLRDIRCPVLLIVGADDAKFVGIAHRMHERLADCKVVLVDGAGHSAHLEQPERTATSLVATLTL